jgi:hypothetical protein
MRYLGTIFCNLFLCFSSLIAQVATSNQEPIEARFTKLDLKEEKLEMKHFESLLKNWKKATKSKNIDFQNNALDNLKQSMSDESLELSNKIALRNKKVSNLNISHEEVDSLTFIEMPRGAMFSKIENQITKSEVENRKTESALLSKYTAIISNQQQLLMKLSKIGIITQENNLSKIAEINPITQEFYSTLKQEIDLMATETKK